MEENNSPQPSGEEAAPNQNPKSPNKPSVALIIGSEGIKSFCALPFIEYLLAEGVGIDLVIGVSGGALLAGFLGTGYDLRQIQDIFSKTVDPRFFTDVDYDSVLEIASTGMGRFSSSSGILKTDCLRRTYEILFKKTDISDLKPRTLIAATELATGEPVILDRGNLAKAIYAGSAIYPLMPPGEIDGRKLIDGAFSSPVPIMECVKRQIDIIIAIYFDDACNPEPESFMESYFNTSRIFKRSILTSQLPLAIDMHHHEIIPVYIKHPRPIELWEVNKLNEIVHAGKVALSNKKENFQDAVQEYSKKMELRAEKRRRAEAEKIASENRKETKAQKKEQLTEQKNKQEDQKQPDTPKRTFKIVKSKRKERKGKGV
ncbi:patatin-like phospholipase family protein [Maridesulfovibrio sp.]|uniref:patatin-like phospholipase family protein n=1 Tax=Maridesulfovibrio sp. TaxID=2795000 RepID=UPI002A18B574|nr:patatin-like phospholipase family protein [Maridesulfovibrio sp.]